MKILTFWSQKCYILQEMRFKIAPLDEYERFDFLDLHESIKRYVRISRDQIAWTPDTELHI